MVLRSSPIPSKLSKHMLRFTLRLNKPKPLRAMSKLSKTSTRAFQRIPIWVSTLSDPTTPWAALNGVTTRPCAPDSICISNETRL